jgi:hypothetical protein
MTIDEPSHDPDEFAPETLSRGRAWAQTILIAVGMLIVGTALVLVIAMLITLTLGLLSELI